MQAGAQYEFVVLQDQLYVMQEVLKEVDPPNLVRYEMTNEVMVSEYDFTLTQDKSHTEITNHYRVIGKNIWWKTILFVSKSYLRSSSQEQLELLKREIEGI